MRLKKEVECLEREYPVSRQGIDGYRDRLHRANNLADHFGFMAFSKEFGAESMNYCKLAKRLMARTEGLINMLYKQFFE